jgi:hypothetical protein
LHAYIDWTEYCDGVNIFPKPVLPADMILPLKVWERPSAMNAIWGPPMENFVDGLPDIPKQTWNGCWEWRANAIYFPGALQVMDFRVLYMRYLGDFVDVSNIPWFQQPVPIVRSQTAFSLYLCAEIDTDNAEEWLVKAQAAAKMMVNREAAMKQRGNVRRQSRSGRLECGGWGWW